MEPSESAADPRQEILYRYRRNEITREQADAEARVVGFESLEFRPDPRDFDPLAMSFWSLPMALAWIVYRKRESVRELIEEYRTQSLVWRHVGRFSINTGRAEKVFELLSPEPKEVFDVVHEANCQDDQTALALTGAEGRNQLWDRLKGGDLIAEGIPPGQTKHSPIRDVEWETLAFQPDSGIPVDAVAGWGENRPRFNRVLVRTVDVLALWPELLEISEDPAPTLIENYKVELRRPRLPPGIPERILYSAQRAELHRYMAVSQKPWEPPPSFSLRLLTLFVDPRIWLRDAIDFMVFGADCELDLSNFRKAYERQRAAKRIFEAARREDIVLSGCKAESTDALENIPPHYFDLQRALGNIDNSIEILHDAISDEDFYANKEKQYQSYRYVRIETRLFSQWLANIIGSENTISLGLGSIKAKAPKRLRDETAKRLIQEAAKSRGGYISLRDGVKLLCDEDQNMKRDAARDIVKSVIGNEKRGPRGPRRNSAK